MKSIYDTSSIRENNSPIENLLWKSIRHSTIDSVMFNNRCDIYDSVNMLVKQSVSESVRNSVIRKLK